VALPIASGFNQGVRRLCGFKKGPLRARGTKIVYVDNKSCSRLLFSRPKKRSRAEIEPHFSAKASLAMASGFNNDERLYQ
jgi:hypothetical protein